MSSENKIDKFSLLYNIPTFTYLVLFFPAQIKTTNLVFSFKSLKRKHTFY